MFTAPESSFRLWYGQRKCVCPVRWLGYTPICIEGICMHRLGRRGGRGSRMLLAVTCAFVCCGSPCLIGGTQCVCLCVCSCNTAHPNTSGPAAAAELILALDVRTPQFPLPRPMRDEKREAQWPSFHFIHLPMPPFCVFMMVFVDFTWILLKKSSFWSVCPMISHIDWLWDVLTSVALVCMFVTFTLKALLTEVRSICLALCL